MSLSLQEGFIATPVRGPLTVNMLEGQVQLDFPQVNNPFAISKSGFDFCLETLTKQKEEFEKVHRAFADSLKQFENQKGAELSAMELRVFQIKEASIELIQQKEKSRLQILSKEAEIVQQNEKIGLLVKKLRDETNRLNGQYNIDLVLEINRLSNELKDNTKCLEQLKTELVDLTNSFNSENFDAKIQEKRDEIDLLNKSISQFKENMELERAKFALNVPKEVSLLKEGIAILHFAFDLSQLVDEAAQKVLQSKKGENGVGHKRKSPSPDSEPGLPAEPASKRARTERKPNEDDQDASME